MIPLSIFYEEYIDRRRLTEKITIRFYPDQEKKPVFDDKKQLLEGKKREYSL